jgi:hypothetical protein
MEYSYLSTGTFLASPLGAKFDSPGAGVEVDLRGEIRPLGAKLFPRPSVCPFVLLH